MTTIFQNLIDEVEIAADGLKSKTLIQDDNVKVVVFGFSAGQELSKHTAPVPVLIQFLSGEADVTCGDQRLIAKTGTLIHLPAQVPHSIAAKTETRMLLTMLKGAK